MGKTTLVEAFLRDLDEGGAIVRVGRGRYSELSGSEAYLPVLEALDSLQRHESLGGLSHAYDAEHFRILGELTRPWAATPMRTHPFEKASRSPSVGRRCGWRCGGRARMRASSRRGIERPKPTRCSLPSSPG
jgi:hypothetical protein